MTQGTDIALETAYAQCPEVRVQQAGVTPWLLDPRALERKRWLGAL